MVEGSYLTAFWIKARQVRPLVEIARNAREGQIFWIICAAVFARDNMLDLVANERRIVFMQVTVFAPAIGPLANGLSIFSAHQCAGGCCLAADCRTAKTL